eukprot:489213_1
MPTAHPTPDPTINMTVEIEKIIKCSEFVAGETTRTVSNKFYHFKLTTENNFAYSVLFSSCGSSYDTAITVLDVNMREIAYYDGIGPCGYQSQLFLNETYSGTYILKIGGYMNSYGSYHM